MPSLASAVFRSWQQPDFQEGVWPVFALCLPDGSLSLSKAAHMAVGRGESKQNGQI